MQSVIETSIIPIILPGETQVSGTVWKPELWSVFSYESSLAGSSEPASHVSQEWCANV